MSSNKNVYFDFNETQSNFSTSIEDALNESNNELIILNETIDSINNLKIDCDKIDYILSASIGALCGIIDIFLVGSSDKSLISNFTDKWYENRIIDFAKLCGYKGNNITNAIIKLEKKLKYLMIKVLVVIFLRNILI